MRAHGINVPKFIIAETPDEAEKAVRDLGYYVVLVYFLIQYFLFKYRSK